MELINERKYDIMKPVKGEKNMNNNNEKKPRIWLTSFAAFLLIGLLQSCQEARLKKEAMEGQIIDSQIPRITYEEMMKPVEEKIPYELIEEKLDEMEEETQEEEDVFVK